MYLPEDTPNFKQKAKKLKKKDKPRFERLMKKINEILEEPNHYEPLSNKMSGVRRAHLDPFVLTFSVDENRRVVRFLDFDHHDKIYKN
ncbi:TPA: type II toxin-antitoxin system mRNA interferase toxin, RelE/StbE family [Candidatus Micrarchaeota archaeon]|nr:type II toxin-antitoxin system mRNA interferase toxin, RelE/StbE family [Candidatus Micrarchaeota archaeon]